VERIGFSFKVGYQKYEENATFWPPPQIFAEFSKIFSDFEVEMCIIDFGFGGSQSTKTEKRIYSSIFKDRKSTTILEEVAQNGQRNDSSSFPVRRIP